MNPFLTPFLQTEPLSHTSQTSRAPCFISVRQSGDKQASILANVVSSIMPERTANQGIRLSSYWKAPKISTALTSPSGNRISLLLQGTESSHPCATSAICTVSMWELDPSPTQTHSKPVSPPGRLADPWAQQEMLRGTEQRVLPYYPSSTRICVFLLSLGSEWSYFVFRVLFLKVCWCNWHCI